VGRRPLAQGSGSKEDHRAAGWEEDLVNHLAEEIGCGQLKCPSCRVGYLAPTETQAYREPHRQMCQRASPLTLAHPADAQPQSPVFEPLMTATNNGEKSSPPPPLAAKASSAPLWSTREIEGDRGGD